MVSSRTPLYKFNTDTKKEDGNAGLGCIIKNCEGAVMAAASSKTKKPCQGDVEIAETLTILEGVKMAVGAGLSPLIIKSDA